MSLTDALDHARALADALAATADAAARQSLEELREEVDPATLPSPRDEGYPDEIHILRSEN